MTKPAARMGDQTAHGGVITLGCTTVLIGNQPAARITDLHTCPMSDGPKPHVGGPILPPGSPTVLIGGLPAARVGDMATCTGPPDTIITGEFTVLIGDSGGGGGGAGGAGGGGGGGTAAAQAGGDEDTTQAAGAGAIAASAATTMAQPEETAPEDQADETPEEAPEPTEDPQVYNVRWQNTQVKCGDTVGMNAGTANIDAGTQADFTIQKISDSSTVATVSENTAATNVWAEWLSKKPSDVWDGQPELSFWVAAQGAEAESGNQLRFHQYRDIAGQERIIARTGTNSAGETARLQEGKFRAEFQDRTIRITVRIKLNNRTEARPSDSGGTREDDARVPIGSAVSDADKDEYKQDIEGYLSEKHKMHRHECCRGETCDCSNACCKFNVEVHVEFVEENAHHTVDLWPGRGRATSLSWYRVKTRDSSRAHETGHLLGWFDEYADAPWHGSPPRWQNNRPGSLMAGSSDIPAEYYDDFRDWFRSRTGEAWDPVNP